MEEKEFVAILKENKINLTPLMIEQFAKYFELIEKYNEVMDLTAIEGKQQIYERHFLNSLTIAFNSDFNNKSLCDVGSGAGFPAIPLKIAFPDMQLTIIDSLSKRVDFLSIVVKELNLKKVTIIPARVEDVAMTYFECFDIVTARAVAKLNILIELCSQIVKRDGIFIAMKGEKGNEELKEAENALKECCFTLDHISTYEPSINIYLKKINHTNRKYPRNYGIIKNKPL